MVFKLFLLICVAVTFVPGHCEEKTSNDEEKARLPEFLTELDVASSEAASKEDVEALKKIVKRLAPEKNGEYLGIQEITGQPGVDYPALTTIPVTTFSCRGQKGGYYADQETNCQVFHICDNGRKISFLCPNGTIFQQSQLICDWWFKVDCSKSAELYEASAEYLAEEERKRINHKKMNSEFHRTTNEDNYLNYDGRQNGRSNPYGNSPSQNALPNGQGVKSTQPYDPNQVYDRQSTKPGNQYSQDTRAKDDYNKAQNHRQQNQLLSNDGKTNTFEKGSNRYFNNQLKSSQEDEYFGSAANLNTQRENKLTIKSSKPRTFTRQNFNNPIPKVTPAYTETTTFRTSTISPIREFQHLAESAAFASSRGNRYKSQNYNQLNSWYSNSKTSTTVADTLQQSTASTTVSSPNDQSQGFVRTRVGGIPAFPGPTYTPIYKPRTTTTTTTTTPAPKEPTTTPRAYTTNYYRSQGSQDQSTTTYSNYDQTTVYAEYTTTDAPPTYITTSYRDKYTNAAQTTYNGDQYETNPPTTQRSSYTDDYYKETTTTTPAITTTSNYGTRDTTRYTDYYTGAFTTLRPVYTQSYGQNTVVDDNKATTVVTYSSDNQDQHVRFGTPKALTKNSGKSQTQQNWINPSTEKPANHNYNDTYDSSRRTPTPYDTSITYQHGKILSTLGPYVPYTKSYSFTTSTTPRPQNYAQLTAYYNQISSRKLIPNSNQIQSYVSSSYGKSGSRATYLPEKTTPSSYTEKSAFDSRPQNEREHALNMLKSLQGLEGNVPSLNLKTVNNTNQEVQNSSGPSTLHSLALYFANSDDSYDEERPTDSAINVQYYETTENPAKKKNASAVDLPASILTQHTISSYAELFNLNNALENNITGDTSYDNSDENLTDEDSDLDIQQSEGPLAGVKKSNNTKLRELAQVFTQALSAYLQDPDTFKKVLTEIRPTEPPESENEITTSPTTTEDYPSVTKEKDEVLDFSDDINGIRRRRPTTTTFPETTTTEILKETTYQPYYTPEYFSTTSSYPDESLNEAQSTYLHQPKTDNKFAYHLNNFFDSKKLNEVQNYKATTYSVSSSSSQAKDSYSNYGGNTAQNNSANTYSPYGKYVKPSDATPISDNYVASSTPATYAVAPPQNFVPQQKDNFINDKLREDLTPPVYQNYGVSNNANTIPTSSIKPQTTVTRSSFSVSGGNSVTPVYKKPQETVTTTTKEPFRIRYYDPTTTVRPQKSESLVTASSLHSRYGNNLNSIRQTERPTKYTSQPDNGHWTSSPTVAQLWETTVFIDPDHINRGLDTDPNPNPSSPTSVDSRSTTTPGKIDFSKTDSNNAVTPQNLDDTSTPWQWAPNNNDSPTAFTLLPNIYSNTENTATPTPTYTTRTSLTTTITSSITATNAEDGTPTRISIFNVTENEIQRAHDMFGSLNETSSNTLMKVMKQADSNATVRQLVLLLITHCNGPMNKTMEEEKEQLLNALLRMPVNEFTSDESRELIRGISKIHLPIGRSSSESSSTTTAAPSTTTKSSEPSVTTYRSRSGRKFKSTPKPSQSYSKVTTNGVKTSPSESRNAVASDEGTISDNRALDLLRSLYTIAAKWG